MTNEPMSLAKNYDPKKTPFPAIAQIKYDGVPATFRKVGDHVVALTRQKEVLKSVDHINKLLSPVLNPGDEVTMELLVKGEVDFKTISGVVRRQVTDERIFGKIFDGARSGFWNEEYIHRYEWFRSIVNKCFRGSPVHKPVQQALGALVHDHNEMLQWYYTQLRNYELTAEKYPTLGIRLEGIMLHESSRPYTPGKRIWGMSRYKPQPTIDLEVVSYEEAISKTGEPLGMVGRVNCLLTRQGRPPAIIGIGPGKMTHAEREAVWRAAVSDTDDPRIRYPADPYSEIEKIRKPGPIAEIKYMPDPSYDALRQPTFQRFRPDKDEADVYNP